MALVSSIEEPHYFGESYAIVYVGFLNALWLYPYAIYYLVKEKSRNIRYSVLIYLVFISPFVLFKLYQRPFNSDQWKAELDLRMFFDGHPAHKNGNMVADLIESNVLIGLPIGDIEELLGKNHFVRTDIKDSTLCYFYSNRNIFDGCDKLYLRMKNGKCADAHFGGCD